MNKAILIFANSRAAARFWFGVSFVLAIICVIQPYMIMSLNKIQEKIVIMDETNMFHVAPVTGMTDAKKLHFYIATLAAKSLFDRSPAGVDNPVMLEQIYIEPSLGYARKIIEEESNEFTVKSMHQKAEIGEINILQTDDNRVLMQVRGQLVRTGTYKNQMFTDSLSFDIGLTLFRNTRLTSNGRLPYAVYNLRYKIEKEGQTNEK